MDRSDAFMLDGRLAHAVDHPVRVSFLRLLEDRGSLSLAEAFKQIEEDDLALSQVGYHVWVLARFGIVELATRRTRKGGASFRATETGKFLMVAMKAGPDST